MFDNNCTTVTQIWTVLSSQNSNFHYYWNSCHMPLKNVRTVWWFLLFFIVPKITWHDLLILIFFFSHFLKDCLDCEHCTSSRSELVWLWWNLVFNSNYLLLLPKYFVKAKHWFWSKLVDFTKFLSKHCEILNCYRFHSVCVRKYT